jgi:hypothetical protein
MNEQQSQFVDMVWPGARGSESAIVSLLAVLHRCVFACISDTALLGCFAKRPSSGLSCRHVLLKLPAKFLLLSLDLFWRASADGLDLHVDFFEVRHLTLSFLLSWHETSDP